MAEKPKRIPIKNKFQSRSCLPFPDEVKEIMIDSGSDNLMLEPIKFHNKRTMAVAPAIPGWEGMNAPLENIGHGQCVFKERGECKSKVKITGCVLTRDKLNRKLTRKLPTTMMRLWKSDKGKAVVLLFKKLAKIL